jgi:HAD superfamily phosphatase
MQPELWIFDLDGTVVDVRDSAREAVRRTVQAYFGQVMGLRGATALVTPREIQAFRLAGGLNNSWELSSALVRYLISLLGHAPRPPEPLENLNDISTYLHRAGRRLNITMADLRQRADFEAIAKQVHEAGGGLDGLTKVLGQRRSHPWFFETGELRNVNVIRRLFQEFYLGRRHYAALHGTQPFFYKGPGLIENERLLIPRDQIEAIAQVATGGLAIATNRPAAEIRLALDTHGLTRYFRAVVSHEDVVSEVARAERRGEPPGSRAKPHPFMLLEAARGLDPDGHRPAVYIGDTPDDIKAAKRANDTRPFLGWGVLWSSIEPDRLRTALADAGADRILEKPDALLT